MHPKFYLQLLRIRLQRPRPLKLHLGCGTNYLKSYINIDTNRKVKADLHLDFCLLNKIFSPRSISETLMIHSLSYLNLWQARDFFKQISILSELNGRLIIELPDITKCAQKIVDCSQRLPDYVEGVRGFYAFDFKQISARELYTPYAFGWSGWHLKQELEDAGFKKVLLCSPQTHEHPWRDFRIEATKI